MEPPILAPPTETATSRPRMVSIAGTVMIAFGSIAVVRGALGGLAGVLLSFIGLTTNDTALWVFGGLSVVLVVAGFLYVREGIRAIGPFAAGHRIAIALGALFIVDGLTYLVVPPIGLALIAGNAFVLLTLVRYRSYLGARPARPKIDTGVSPWQVLAGVGLVFAILIAGAIGYDSFQKHRPLSYLRDLPEAALVYPGATAMTTHERPEEFSLFAGRQDAERTTRYTVDASRDEVTTWYAMELEPRGWRSAPINLGSDRAIPTWRGDFATLQLSFSSEPVGTADRPLLAYSMVLRSRYSADDLGPLAPLDAMAESDLAYPRSTPGQFDRQSGRTIYEDRVAPAYVLRAYETTVSSEAVVAFYDAELARSGWQRLDPPPGDLATSFEPIRAWGKGAAIARLSTHTRDGLTRYEFSISEVPGPEIKPGVPW